MDTNFVIGRKLSGGYDSMMDNSCKSVDGHIFKIPCSIFNDLTVYNLWKKDVDCGDLTFRDFMESRCSKNETQLIDEMV